MRLMAPLVIPELQLGFASDVIGWKSYQGYEEIYIEVESLENIKSTTCPSCKNQLLRPYFIAITNSARMFLPVSLLALTLSAIPLTSATPTPIARRSNCTNPTIRKEWRTLSREEQINYVEAVNCLTTNPSRIGLSSPLYDDFPYVHNQLNNESKFSHL